MTDSVLSASRICKRYDSHVAVDELSFDVLRGEIFGLLGPNGAGKTSTIRILMDIFRADSGKVELLGGDPGQRRDRVGYLPEERGLYRDQRVLEVLIYLGMLKGVDGATARARALELLERVDLEEWGGKRVKELSRGMQQKVQFIACLIHDPELLILDEPFQGLDPVNVEMIKGLMRSLVGEGKTIVLSAHQMNLVDELCDRILLIDEGRALLYGSLKEIKQDFAPNSVRVRAADLPSDLPGVVGSERHGDFTLLTLDGIGAQAFLATLVERKVQVESFERAMVPLNDIFVAMVQGNSQ